mmetsp:Transcript_2706/g.8213  ORF Transcript_2706/g.8213 Transcript_2706/m.8213 type:complete len:780 (-) Transcript_2706:130-2469(-)|eukprot:CAMPEP_0198737318 /NCGR_PEP_ID=MMETSP1475-20131203/67804_1 /TAXON_ID= ORGANISM="Unidentified sp., Strain CCMP1999" /NCGR_SAMPLE_ID=MMETSP1475 /ASSEMBLY_ACC=CAM_ASM_001111 /LENGTH=779 /DNA_ID=CAMNT_0044501179 /DNA_START=136 /DNA_END=2475 /DNA_ORIENTATION=+
MAAWWRPVALLAVLTSFVALRRAAAAPAIAFEENRPVAVQDVTFSLVYQPTFAQTDNLVDKTALHTRVTWNSDVLSVTSTDLFTEGEGIVSEVTVADLVIPERGWQDVTVEVSFNEDFTEATTETHSVWLVPGGVTLLSPLIVIVVAIWTREVLFALFIGIFFAAFVVYQYNPFLAFLRTMDTYLVNALADTDHAFVIFFTFFLSGLVACISRSGGSFGIADVFSKFARTRMSVQLVIFVLGFVIFFDDYANTLILGNTMRLISDSMWISREKLAFLVDATTAPIASIAPVSSWIGFEVGLIEAQLERLRSDGEDLAGVEENAYLIFLQTIPSRFYPILMLFFQFFLIVSKREFGSMLLAERRAIDQHKLYNDDAKIVDDKDEAEIAPLEGTPRRWWNGVVPIFFVIFLVLLAILLTGRVATLEEGAELSAQNIFGNGDPFSSLMYGGLTATFIAWIMYRLQYVAEDRIVFPFLYWLRCKKCPGRPLMNMEQNLNAFISGVKSVLTPIIVLILAWAIGDAITESGADLFFASALQDSIDPRALPTLTFIIASIISFCTGTSWGTMSILFPLIVPTSWYAARDPEIFVLTISAILSGAVFGDHCTPISDTTILSSIASRCDVMDHTLTQIPYALWVSLISIMLGYVPTSYGVWPNWAGLLIGALFSIIFITLIGVRVDHPKRRLDPIALVVRWIWHKVFRQNPEKPTKVTYDHEYDADEDKEFVDILRPNFWKISTWKKKWASRKDKRKYEHEHKREHEYEHEHEHARPQEDSVETNDTV